MSCRENWNRSFSLALYALLLAVAGCSGAGAERDSAAGELIDLYDIEPGEITTVAGGGRVPRGIGPRDAALLGLCGTAVDPRDETVYVSDSARHVIFRIRSGGETIEAFAGTGYAGFNGDGLPASETALHVPCQLAIHPESGDVYVADTHNYRIRAIARDGSTVRTVAGSGVKGYADSMLPTEAPLGPGLAFGNFSGDGGAPTEAELNLPAGLAIDGSGNLYIGDAGNNRIRVVNTQEKELRIGAVAIPPGSIQTIAGTGGFGGDGDGGPAVEAQLAYPKNVAVDRRGNVAFADSLNGRLRIVDGKSGEIRTLARSIPQTNPLNMIGVSGVGFDTEDRLYYSDLNGHAVFRIDIETAGRELVAGIGTSGFSSDGTIARVANISAPAGLAIGPDGDVYFVEVSNNRLRRIHKGKLVTVAGGGSPGEKISATAASFSVLAPISMDGEGHLYIGDANLHTVRRVDRSTGHIETFAGTGNAGFPTVGTPLLETDLVEPAVAFLPNDPEALYLKDPAAGVIRKVVQTDGGYQLADFAGSGVFGVGGDNGPATDAEFSVPLGLARHPATGEYYISTVWMPKVRKIDNEGIITTVVGSGGEGYAGDDGPALQANFHWLTTIDFDKAGNLYLVDYFNNRIRVVSPAGEIRTFAGTGEKGFGGDGGPAVHATLNNPNDLVIDEEGNLYFTDVNNHRVRMIEADPPHRVVTIAGNGRRGFSGDQGPATEASLNVPRALAMSPTGRALYITDSFNGRVRAVRLR